MNSADTLDPIGQSRRIAVVGSLNVDHFFAMERNPLPGETVLADLLMRTAGGKGANQAIGCARLGHQVWMAGCVGADADGQWLRERVRNEGVDVTDVAIVPEAPTGAAYIFGASGESTIVVVPGANALLAASAVTASTAITIADAVLCQLEIPLDAVQAAVVASRGLVILNPAPAQALSPELLHRVDVLVPNRLELASLTGTEPTTDIDRVIDLARSIPVRQGVVVTLGGMGAVAVTHDHSVRVPAWSSHLVDSTAAGDSFCAALADGLLSGMDLAEATQWAVVAASVTVSRLGAIDSLPRRDEVACRMLEGAT